MTEPSPAQRSAEMSLAPVVLFVYNRPEHTRRALEALRHNPEAARTELVIYADGPLRECDRAKVAAVRELLQEVPGFRRVTVRAAESNRGLASSIIDGVTRVVTEHGRAIVLEDDLVVSPHFLAFMNEALAYYAEAERVMHVSGYWFPIGLEPEPSAFFLPVPSSWGWATWARAWRWFEKDPVGLTQQFSPEDRRRFNLDGANDFWEQVVHNLKGKADTWAIFWYAAIFRRKGLCLYPSRSLVRNDGSDGSGVHCVITDIYQGELAPDRPARFPTVLEENSAALTALKAFYRKHRIGRLRRFAEVVRVKVRRLRAERN